MRQASAAVVVTTTCENYFCDVHHKKLAWDDGESYNYSHQDNNSTTSFIKVSTMRKLLKKLLNVYINAYKDVPPGAIH
ncbi:stress response protein AzuC [Brenneria sp. g21c3]|uniref:stress response protein AzuC n=1 Tax=Brenneria sp. g21c3 TaxID=3093893 RepID=UPI0032EAE0B8